jgi:hypothetical protein
LTLDFRLSLLRGQATFDCLFARFARPKRGADPGPDTPQDTTAVILSLIGVLIFIGVNLIRLVSIFYGYGFKTSAKPVAQIETALITIRAHLVLRSFPNLQTTQE